MYFNKIIHLKNILLVILTTFFCKGVYSQCPALGLTQTGVDCHITFTIDTPDFTPLFYSNMIWDFGDGTIVNSNTQTISHTYCSNEKEFNVSVSFNISTCPETYILDTLVTTALCPTVTYQSNVDLEICSINDDSGFIHIITSPNNTVEWQYSSTTTIEESNPNVGENMLLNIDPGEYILTITDGICNIETETFIVTEECCEDDSSCLIPSGLYVGSFVDFPLDWFAVKLTWDYVPDAVGYLIEIAPANIGGYDCQLGDSIITPIEIQTTVNSWKVAPQKLEDSCFAWRVKVLCEDGSSSEFSPYVSFDNPYPSPN